MMLVCPIDLFGRWVPPTALCGWWRLGKTCSTGDLKCQLVHWWMPGVMPWICPPDEPIFESGRLLITGDFLLTSKGASLPRVPPYSFCWPCPFDPQHFTHLIWSFDVSSSQEPLLPCLFSSFAYSCPRTPYGLMSVTHAASGNAVLW